MTDQLRYTTSHWGIYEVRQGRRGPQIDALTGDPDPSPIGLHQLSPELKKTRVRRPSIRKSWLENGPGSAPELRGSDPFVEVDWDVANDLVARELQRVRAGHGNEAIFGGSYGWASAGRFHHGQSQVHRFLNCVGGYVAHRDSYSLGAARVLMPHIVAPMSDLMKSHNSWGDLAENCDLFITFGGVPAKNAQISQAGAGRHLVREGLRRMAGAGVEFVNVSPIADNIDTGGPVDWIEIRPNTDTAFMLALAYEIWARNGCDQDFLDRFCVGWPRFLSYLSGEHDSVPKTPEWAQEICTVPARRIRELADRMIGRKVMINIVWALQRADHGEQPFWMVVTLAAMLGQIGLPGGGFGVGYGCENMLGSPHAHLPGPSLPQGRNPVRTFIPVARIADMLLHPGQEYRYNGGTYRYPDIHLVYWVGGNPYHHHQDLGRLQKAWQKPETIIVHEQFWTATAQRADIVLPATTTTERDDISYSSLEGFLVASRAVEPPFADARDDYDIFAGIAAKMELADAFTENRSSADWQRHLYIHMREEWARRGVEVPHYDGFVEKGLVDLGGHAATTRIMLSDFRSDPEKHLLATPSGRIEIFSETIENFGLPDCGGHARWIEPIEWLGAKKSDVYPFHLISDQPERRLHSQLDASPHSRAGKIGDREPVSMSPLDASEKGLVHGQTVELFNERGRCLAALKIDPNVAPGVLRLSTGAWYDPDPRTGIERHGNPNALTADRPASELSQGCTAHSCLVAVRPAGEDAAPPAPFSRLLVARD